MWAPQGRELGGVWVFPYDLVSSEYRWRVPRAEVRGAPPCAPGGEASLPTHPTQRTHSGVAFTSFLSFASCEKANAGKKAPPRSPLWSVCVCACVGCCMCCCMCFSTACVPRIRGQLAVPPWLEMQRASFACGFISARTSRRASARLVRQVSPVELSVGQNKGAHALRPFLRILRYGISR